ncbi:hypothetical protein A9X63_26375 [Klebsiella pneumoniae]|nr:hypothetical protein A9X63_26375 [Klebsiella pneumoniae]
MLNNASAATVQAPPYTSERQRTLATLVVSIALVLEIIDVSIINVAIPVVQRDLLASPRQIEWVVTGYLFFFLHSAAYRRPSRRSVWLPADVH